MHFKELYPNKNKFFRKNTTGDQCILVRAQWFLKPQISFSVQDYKALSQSRTLNTMSSSKETLFCQQDWLVEITYIPHGKDGFVAIFSWCESESTCVCAFVLLLLLSILLSLPSPLIIWGTENTPTCQSSLFVTDLLVFIYHCIATMCW